MISDTQAKFFRENGFLKIEGVLHPDELLALQTAMDDLTNYGSQVVRDDPDYMYSPGHLTGKPVLKRVEYVIDKKQPCKALLGHPFILRSVEMLMGPDFIPTWDSMVLKMPGEGIVVPWHRDAGSSQVGDCPVFNVDFYLDDADLDTCLWVYPGSHEWPEEQVRQIISRDGFSTEGAIPVPMKPGDVIFHNILVLHGSPANSSNKLRRVIYYEFRAAHVEEEIGPHTPDYIPLKQKLLLECLEIRSHTGYANGETPFQYNPPHPYEISRLDASPLSTHRFAHEQYWRQVV